VDSIHAVPTRNTVIATFCPVRVGRVYGLWWLWHTNPKYTMLNERACLAGGTWHLHRKIMMSNHEQRSAALEGQPSTRAAPGDGHPTLTGTLSQVPFENGGEPPSLCWWEKLAVSSVGIGCLAAKTWMQGAGWAYEKMLIAADTIHENGYVGAARMGLTHALGWAMEEIQDLDSSSLTEKVKQWTKQIINWLKIRYHFSVWLNASKEAGKYSDHDILCDKFSDQILVGEAIGQTLQGHADRNRAQATIEQFCHRVSRPYWHYMRGAREENQGGPGSRSYFADSDFHLEPADEPIPTNAVISVISNDYYVDMNRFVNRYQNPILLYTIQPTRLARSEGQCSYFFSKNSQLVFLADGGIKYRHMLWNYSQSVISFVYTIMGFPIRLTTCRIIRKRTGYLDHEMVLILPIKRWSWDTAWIPYAWLNLHRLGRYTVSDPSGLNVLKCKPWNSEPTVSVGMPDDINCSNLLLRNFQGDEMKQLMSKTGLNVTQLQNVVMSSDAKDYSSTEEAAPLLYYLKSIDRRKPLSFVLPGSQALVTYQFAKFQWDDEARPGMTVFMSPLVHGSYKPAKTASSEAQAVYGRVLKYVTVPGELPFTSELDAYMEEFISHFIPADVEYTYHPEDQEAVEEAQCSRQQQRILRVAENTALDAKETEHTSTFMKGEAAQKFGDDRIISQIAGPVKRDYSTFTMAATKYLKTQEWYAFGHEPRWICNRVAKITSGAKFCVNTDFKRFDGHVSEILRDLEWRCLARLFRKEYHPLLHKLHKKQYMLKAKTMLGISYFTWYTRLSGSPETALFNSIDNAFIGYLAARLQGLSSDAAWQAMGIYGGDDGLTADIHAEFYLKASAMVGQQVVIEEIQRGQIGVRFLARIYSPDFGSQNSMCDLLRTLSKLHCTPNLPSNVTPLEKLKEKVRGLILSDRYTPIVGRMCSRIEELNGGEIKYDSKLADMVGWNATFDAKEHYVNELEDWMYEVVSRDLPGVDVKAIEAKFGEYLELNSFLSMPLLLDRSDAKPSEPVVRDDGQLDPNGADPGQRIQNPKQWVAKREEELLEMKRSEAKNKTNTPKQVCKRCKLQGHKAKDCKKNFGKSTCHKCGKSGHISSNCKEPIVCYKCKTLGHKAVDCKKVAK